MQLEMLFKYRALELEAQRQHYKYFDAQFVEIERLYLRSSLSNHRTLPDLAVPDQI